MRTRAFSLATILVLSAAFPARAHDAISGAGPFVNGLLHPIVDPGPLLSLLALGLWIGRQERDALRRCVAAFAVALIAGLIAGPLVALPPSVPLAMAVLLGCLAASDRRGPARLAATIALAAAALIGFDSASGFHRAYRRWTGGTPGARAASKHRGDD